MRAGRGLRLAVLLIASAARLPAQEENATFTTEVKVVNVLATARTKKGEIVSDLTKGDFTLSENGRPQTIRYFARQTDLPLTLGLMVDTSMSQERVLNSERSASFRFLDQVLRENQDQVFIMQFDLALMMRQALTSSRRKLEESLSLVDTPTRQELSMQRGGGTLLYDAVIKACQDVMKGQKNRKALIVLSDGVDTGSESDLASAVDWAVRTDTLVYSILFADEIGFGSSGRWALQRLSKETGGGFFEVSKKQGIEKIFDTIQDELRNQYSLGFVSDNPVRISELRSLKLTTDRKGLVLQARDKYWAQR